MTFGALKHINHAEGFFFFFFLNLSKQMWQFTRFHAVCTCCLNKAALWSMSIPSAESWSKSTISLRCTTTDPGYIILWHNQAKKMMRINFSPCQSSLQSSLVVMFDFYHCAPWPSCCLKCRELPQEAEVTSWNEPAVPSCHHFLFVHCYFSYIYVVVVFSFL